MHAVVTSVTINDVEGAESYLREAVVPRISQAPGFVAGYWMRKDNSGLSVAIFETADAAEQVSGRIPGMATDEVTLDNVEVREVVASA